MKSYLLCLISLFIVSCGDNDVPPGTTPDTKTIVSMDHTARVTRKTIFQTYDAVGTIRPLTESSLEARIPGQVLFVGASIGDRVEAGSLLVKLDDGQLSAQLSQAREGERAAQGGLNQSLKGVDAAKAAMDQARAAHERTQSLFKKQILASQQLEMDRAAFLTARARLDQARKSVDMARARLAQAKEVVREATIGLEYTQILAPAAGVVVHRHVDPGDQALPGKPLLTIQTSGALRLEAQVREGMIPHIVKGKTYRVFIQGPQKTVDAKIQEVAPYADPNTRTFKVKAALPRVTGVYPGMFGRLMVPIAPRKALIIPAQAVVRIGQLEMVNVKTGPNVYSRVFITTGETMDKGVEVLSGLNENDELGW